MDKPNVLVPSFGLSHSFHPAHYSDPLFSPSCHSLPLPHLFDLFLSIPRSFCVLLRFVVYIDNVTPPSTHSFGRTLSFFLLPLLFSGIWSSLFYGLLRSFFFGFRAAHFPFPRSFCRAAVITAFIHSFTSTTTSPYVSEWGS